MIYHLLYILILNTYKTITINGLQTGYKRVTKTSIFFKLKNIIYFGKISIFQKFFWVFKNGQKKCPKSKTKNTFWKKLVKNGL